MKTFCGVLVLFMLGLAVSGMAQTAPPLGSVSSFGVLGGSAVTATGPAGTVVSGDVGSAPTPAVTGFPPALVSTGFTVYTAANAVTTNARTAAGVAYNNLAAQGCTTNVPADLSLLPQPLLPGVYCMGAGGLTGSITLSGSASDIWVFKTASSFTAAASSNVSMSGGASSCNVYWQVGSSATLGANSTFRGSMFALASISIGTSVNLVGRAIAGTGSVTLDGSDTIGGCSALSPPVCPIISLSPATTPNGTVGVAYSQTLVGVGGVAPYSFGITAGALPAGLTLTAAGVIAGTPTTAGTSVFTIKGTDVNGCFISVAYTVVISAAPVVCPVITLSPASLPNGRIGTVYSQTIIGVGGATPYNFVVTAGTLPAGLTLTAAGVLAGTPTTAGIYTFTVKGTDAHGCFVNVAYTVSIAVPIPTLSEWVGILLVVLLAIFGSLSIRRRREQSA